HDIHQVWVRLWSWNKTVMMKVKSDGACCCNDEPRGGGGKMRDDDGDCYKGGGDRRGAVAIDGGMLLS
ncbi:unnamed protein product, partial [Dovyalis caffra]